MGSSIIDLSTGAARSIEPGDIDLTLEKAEEGASSNAVTMVTHQDRQKVKWIRIRCADSSGNAGTVLSK